MEVIQPSYRIVRPDGIEGALAELRAIEREARRCYTSEGSITDDSWKPFIQRLIKNKHYAMLGFGEMHVEFICDRGVTHEMVRHRLCEFAQESTRYCNYGGGGIKVICPDEIRGNPQAFAIWREVMAVSEHGYEQLTGMGVKAQIARAVLPTCLKTELGWKANFQEWRHIFSQRAAKTAHPDMRQLMVPLLAEVKHLIPVVFADL